MDDLISRQAVLEATSTTLKITGKENAETVYGYIKKLCDDIKALPSAQQWIPCSERLPEIGQTVITSSDLGSVREATYKGFDAWTIHGVVHWTDEILSWMPLPEPYKEDE